MTRREFISLLGSAAAAWPLAAHAQQRAMPVIGYLSFPPIAASPHFLAAFRKGLDAEGFAEGQNLSIEFRSADGKAERLSELAADLARRQVGVIAAPSPPSALAAKRATQTIPIVFTSGADPVQIGLVSSLNRPGGNVTGFYFLLPELVAKRLGLLHELLPQAKRIAILINPINASDAETTLRQAAAAARELNLEIETINASTVDPIEAALAALANRQPDALLIAPDPFFTGRAMQPVIAMARQERRRDGLLLRRPLCRPRAETPRLRCWHFLPWHTDARLPARTRGGLRTCLRAVGRSRPSGSAGGVERLSRAGITKEQCGGAYLSGRAARLHDAGNSQSL
jgi:putative tryptophan/tyrosine transport system substrate-binding protein